MPSETPASNAPYALEYLPRFKEHLKFCARQYHSLIRREMEEQLLFEPTVETRNRKPLRAPLFEADWELRFGPDNRFRVFYTCDEENRIVYVHAIGVKERNRFFVGGQ